MLSSLATVYLNDSQAIVFTCPQCGQPHVAPSGEQKSQAVTCTCGQRIPLVRHTRQDTRYPTRLHGTCAHLGSTLVESILIISLSRSGISFRTLLPHNLRVEDIVEIGFILDNAEHTPLMFKASIRWIKQRAVGAMFKPDDKHIALLTTYLQSWKPTST
ncbi:MAG: PilZ domain-containing protein [Candidatus Tectomicrobia bacterium]|nr:PilZ domain-containing protein [Candidatus Tectomicrobia bacterium]